MYAADVPQGKSARQQGKAAQRRKRLLIILLALVLSSLAGTVALFYDFTPQGSSSLPSASTSAPLIPTGPRTASKPPLVSSSCSRFDSCLSCLVDKSDFRLPSHGCVWCANRNTCVPAGQAALECEDVENVTCPAILMTRIPQTLRVIHVAIRKGGPEALLQLFLALAHWGFNTTFDTRHSQKEKGGPIVPFFSEMYRDEIAAAPPLRWSRDYSAWHASATEGDVMIATETWPCVRHDDWKGSGIRQMQWHLTVWPRRDRSQCTIAAHTNYIASQYMRQSRRSLLFPYISPHILALAEKKPSWTENKEDIVLYDSDTKLKDADLASERGVVRKAMIATGYAPADLYALYGKAKAGVDLRLPGAERFVYEAVLFDVCVVVDSSLNGGDLQDLVLPDEFRVEPENLTALNIAVDRCIRDYDQVIPRFEPLKRAVRQQRVHFLRHVRRYFSNSVHVVGVVCSDEDSRAHTAKFIVNTLVQMPFATVELWLADAITTPDGLDDALRANLTEDSWLAAVQFTRMSAEETVAVCGAPPPPPSPASAANSDRIEKSTLQMLRALFLTRRVPSTNGARSLVTMFAPLNVLFVDEHAAHYSAMRLRLAKHADSVFHADWMPALYSASLVDADEETIQVSGHEWTIPFVTFMSSAMESVRSNVLTCGGLDTLLQRFLAHQPSVLGEKHTCIPTSNARSVSEAWVAHRRSSVRHTSPAVAAVVKSGAALEAVASRLRDGALMNEILQSFSFFRSHPTWYAVVNVDRSKPLT